MRLPNNVKKPSMACHSVIWKSDGVRHGVWHVAKWGFLVDDVIDIVPVEGPCSLISAIKMPKTLRYVQAQETKRSFAAPSAVRTSMCIAAQSRTSIMSATCFSKGSPVKG